MKAALLDTSIFIDFLRSPKKKDSLFIELIKREYTLFTSVIVQAELYAGKSVWEQKKAYQEIEDTLANVKILPLTTEIAKKAGYIRALYRTPLDDCIIAATAFVHNLELVTLNKKHFESIKGLQLHESL